MMISGIGGNGIFPSAALAASGSTPAASSSAPAASSSAPGSAASAATFTQLQESMLAGNMASAASANVAGVVGVGVPAGSNSTATSQSASSPGAHHHHGGHHAGAHSSTQGSLMTQLLQQYQVTGATSTAPTAGFALNAMA
jgi:hypothetical protein